VGVIASPSANPPKSGVGYDVGKISACCLVFTVFICADCQFDEEYFWNTGLTVMLAVDESLAYHKDLVQLQIVTLLDKVVAVPSFANGSVISWLVTWQFYSLSVYSVWYIPVVRRIVVDAMHAGPYDDVSCETVL